MLRVDLEETMANLNRSLLAAFSHLLPNTYLPLELCVAEIRTDPLQIPTRWRGRENLYSYGLQAHSRNTAAYAIIPPLQSSRPRGIGS